MNQEPPSVARPHSAEYFGESRDHWWNQDFLRLMAQRLDFAHIASVLDVGCGMGHWGRALEGVLPPHARLTGVDREAEWVREATAQARRKGLSERFRYHQGDATSLPFADSSFDLVTCQTVLMHLPDPRDGLREMLRVAKPGGLVLVVEPSNLANHAVFNSLNECLPTEEIIDSLRFQLVCQRGKKSLGLGFNSVGDLVPGLLAALGASDIRVYLADKVTPLFPPYSRPDQQADVAQLREWAQRDFYVWDKGETRRYFLAGGGPDADFERLWELVCGQQRAVVAAIDAETYHSGAGSIGYLVSGRKA